MTKKGSSNVFIREKSFYKSFALILLAIAGQNLLSYGVNLVDNTMLGSFDQAALAGNSLSDQVQFILTMVVGGLSQGVLILGAQYYGRGQIAPILKIIAVALRAIVIFCFAMFLVCAIFPGTVIGLLTNDTQVKAEGAKLLRLVSFSFVFYGITTVLISALRSVQSVRIGLILSAITLGISIVLNYIFIFGRFGLPRMGILGAGIATVTTRALELVIVLLYIHFREKTLVIHWKELLSWDQSYWRDYRRTAFPVTASNAIWGLAMAIQAAILGHLGADVTAANAIALVTFQIVSVICYGAANAASVLMGNCVGRGDMTRIRQMTRTLQVIFPIMGLIASGLLFCSKGIIIQFFQISPAAEAMAQQFMSILCVTVIGTSYQMAALSGIVCAGGDTKFILRNDLIFQWLIVIPSALLSAFVFHFSPWVVFMCLKSDQVLKCVVAVFKVNSYNWVHSLTRSPEQPANNTASCRSEICDDKA